jgi:hypothetical protein
MNKGIDCTAQITTAVANDLKAQGITFVCRYLVPANMAWKRLTKIEAEAMTTAGIDILSIFEKQANSAAGGRDAGLSDGAAALAEARTIGQPEGSAIYFAVDYDALPKEFDTIEAYLKAAESAITGYKVGVYGSFALCEEMSKRGIPHCWQTYAWSHGEKSSNANVYQYQNNAVISGITCDLDESYGNEGFWNLKPAAMTFEQALDILANKAGISKAYWVIRGGIDPNFELLIIKIAKAMQS